MLELPVWWWLAPLASVLALLGAWRFHRELLTAAAGDDRMQAIAGLVRAGAFAYLRQQYRVVAIVFAALALLLAWQAFGLGQQHGLVPFAFLTGGVLSGLAGWIGMNTATQASSRTAQAARNSLSEALRLSFRAGAVMGLVVVGLGLLHITLWFWVLAWLLPRLSAGFAMPLEEIAVVMLSFGIGASVMALFARVGGGIFTKSADVGADLVGKTEAGIPEDDPRNPAVIADNVGDNVGDVAGMGADLFESYCGSILATAVLGTAAAAALGLPAADKLVLVLLPMTLAGMGILLSLGAIHLVHAPEGASQRQLLWALRRGIWGCAALLLPTAGLLCWGVLPAALWAGIFGAITTGLLAGVLIGWTSEYWTSDAYPPTRWIADQARTGAATTILAGLAQGMLSAWTALGIVSLATLLAYGMAGGWHAPELGLYGIGIAAVGMLATLGITLATDAYGPVADNAGGNAEMTHQPPAVRERTDALDALGNTTAATGKGFAIGSAALTALALLAAFVEAVRGGIDRQADALVQAAPALPAGPMIPIGRDLFVQRPADAPGTSTAYLTVSRGRPYRLEQGTAVPISGNPAALDGAAEVRLLPVREARFGDLMEFYQVNLMNPRLLVGIFLGVMLVFVFCGLTLLAVGRAAGAMVEEVRRQFRELNLLTDPNAQPDSTRCVSIATRAAQREMVLPALLAFAAPIVVGLVLNVSGVMGLLAGSLACGFAMAVFMANAGGAWDNAKKHIEAGHLGGKGSEAHRAAVVGDTVGDPFKDTTGPSLNILIKLMSMVAVIFAGVIVQYGPPIAAALGLDR